MIATRRCWWCGREAEVDTSLPESNGLIRDDSTMDGSESWICSDFLPCLRKTAGTAGDGPLA
jgi:hypothetical protein